MSTESKTPDRYRHPSGVECWQISCHLPHPLASAFEYVWRHRQKGGVEDLQKALRWIELEVERRKSAKHAFTVCGEARVLMGRVLEKGCAGAIAMWRIFLAAHSEDPVPLATASAAINRLIEECGQ